jgi:hypothetical protein
MRRKDMSVRSVVVSIFSAYSYEKSLLTLANGMLDRDLFVHVDEVSRLRPEKMEASTARSSRREGDQVAARVRNARRMRRKDNQQTPSLAKAAA